MEKEFYDFSAKRLSGEEVNMAAFKGKAVLIVNTASKCGLTSQYEGLEKLHKTYNAKGLEVLGFPCNQFAGQEPGNEEEIASFCTTNYGVSFPMFQKIKVNGSDAHPLYKFLKKKKGGLLGSSIKWNFAKFLVDPKGKVIKRYAPTTPPEKLKKDIEACLNN